MEECCTHCNTDLSVKAHVSVTVALQESVCLMCKALETHFPAPQKQNSLDVRMHSYNPSAWEVDVKVSRVQGCLQLQNGFEALPEQHESLFQ